MAQRAVHLDRETFSCSICLDLLKDPVTIPCGHSYCFSCIKDYWDGEKENGIYSCPQCRKEFMARPELLKNTMLAAVVEELKNTGLQDAPADHCYAGAEDVACDVCTGRKLKALKSCLVCLVSYCDTHLQPHRDVAPLRKHQLVDPSKNLKENICSQHDKLMEMFCRSDQKCICYLCSVDEHKGHDIVSAAAEKRQRQEELQESRRNIQQRIRDREEDVKVLQNEVKDINLSADEAVDHSQNIYMELIRLMEKRSSDVKQQIRSQQEAEVSRVRELQEKLEKEITELRSKDAELQQLSNTEDHCHFFHNYPSESQVAASTHSSSIHIHPRRYFEEVTKTLSESRDILQLLKNTWTNISLTKVDALLSADLEPQTRAEFLRYSCDITLDPNTAHALLLLSKGYRRATGALIDQLYPYHPDRFIQCYQVLSRESLSGRHYLEVKWRGMGKFSVAVTYKNISRVGGGKKSGFLCNDNSWALYRNDLSYEFRNNKIRIPLPVPQFSRVGVYLDHPAGVVSFYSVTRTMTLLHRVQTSFTQPLHVGLWVEEESSSAELCKLK